MASTCITSVGIVGEGSHRVFHRGPEDLPELVHVVGSKGGLQSNLLVDDVGIHVAGQALSESRVVGLISVVHGKFVPLEQIKEELDGSWTVRVLLGQFFEQNMVIRK